MPSGQALMHSPQRSHLAVNFVSFADQGGRNGFCFPLKSPRKNCKRLMEVAITIESLKMESKALALARVTTQGNHKGLPLHKNIFGTRQKNLVVEATLYGCPE